MGGDGGTTMTQLILTSERGRPLTQVRGRASYQRVAERSARQAPILTPSGGGGSSGSSGGGGPCEAPKSPPPLEPTGKAATKAGPWSSARLLTGGRGGGGGGGCGGGGASSPGGEGSGVAEQCCCGRNGRGPREGQAAVAGGQRRPLPVCDDGHGEGVRDCSRRGPVGRPAVVPLAPQSSVQAHRRRPAGHHWPPLATAGHRWPPLATEANIIINNSIHQTSTLQPSPRTVTGRRRGPQRARRRRRRPGPGGPPGTRPRSPPRVAEGTQS
jgi:hypothetical protein